MALLQCRLLDMVCRDVSLYQIVKKTISLLFWFIEALSCSLVNFPVFISSVHFCLRLNFDLMRPKLPTHTRTLFTVLSTIYLCERERHGESVIVNMTTKGVILMAAVGIVANAKMLAV